MPSSAQAKRDYYKAVMPTSKNTALADLEAEYFTGAAAGTVAASPAATAATAGVVKKAATVAPATDAASVITQLNALIVSMRAAGQIV